ncbi:bifunctional adenosylcobinamide kinase/adenosylcobinamide-phosphate guanylyltransferase [Peribacillus glennii]|uniref:Uncharacterized protein n=1 Tax=Peribacillus glennii TaxID=2303991 RepID=A0A372LAI0_9BACI|nr:bifunctional adenosylcobinamide kinase/adenosylcobinamide-phosphate guanylyltransferase [Peribacillus glennii]RFU62396.1 hypothetical protein D0466_14560 [Peribacillus glennii]
MHFVTGGAYNGKSRWVREHYKAKDIGFDQWISAYHPDGLPKDSNFPHCNAIVIEGMEQFIKVNCLHRDTGTCRRVLNSLIEDWLAWENDEQQRLLVIIGTDITKGIVPMEKEERIWRDITGWIYQDISSKADRVDVIWYGLNKQIK